MDRQPTGANPFHLTSRAYRSDFPVERGKLFTVENRIVESRIAQVAFDLIALVIPFFRFAPAERGRKKDNDVMRLYAAGIFHAAGIKTASSSHRIVTCNMPSDGAMSLNVFG